MARAKTADSPANQDIEQADAPLPTEELDSSLPLDSEFEVEEPFDIFSAISDSLAAPLDRNRVKTNYQGMSYLEGYDIINTANIVFGHLNWSMHTERLVPTDLGYFAVVVVEVYLPNRTPIRRSGTGYGAVAAGNAGRKSEHEDTAVKAAETDAMKRAFRTFGNQFGNSLYEKTGNATAYGGGGGNRPSPQRSNSGGGYSGGGSNGNYSRPAVASPAAATPAANNADMGWNPGWRVKNGPCVQYDEEGTIVPDSGKKLDEMTDDELSWYYNQAMGQIQKNEYVAHNQKCVDYIAKILPHVTDVAPVAFRRPRRKTPA